MHLTSREHLWLLHPDAAPAALAWLRQFAAVVPPPPEKLAEARDLATHQLRRVSGKVGVLPVHGMVLHRYDAWAYWTGAFTTELGVKALDAYLADASVEAIVLDVNSPGGTSYGVEEFAERVFEARQRKPIHAVANPLAASAAYWLASAAGNLYVTPSGDVGSVGVYALHADMSAALEKEGVKVTTFRRPEKKADVNPYEPLSDDARAFMQERVDETYGVFVKAVARNRGVGVADVRANFGQGRVVSAAKARDAGMADGVMTLEALLARLGGEPVAPRRGPSAQMMRLRHEHAKRATAGGVA